MSVVDWFPALPDGWEIRRADAVLTYVKTVISNDEIASEQVCHYSIPAIQETGDPIIQNGAEIESDKIRLEGGELLVSKLNPHKGCVVLTKVRDELIVCSTEFVPLIAKATFNIRYGYYLYLSTPVRELIASTVQSVTRSHQRADPADIAKIRVPVPPLRVQHFITAFLDRETARLDALIATKERMLRLLDEKRRALVTRAVTRGVDPDVQMRDSGVPWLGEVPAHWEIPHLRRVLACSDYGISDAVQRDGDVAVLRMGDINDGEVDFSNLGFVAGCDPDLLLNRGDLLFNRTNSLDQIGKVGLVSDDPATPTTFASYLVRLRCSERILPEFLNYFLNSTYALAWGRAEALPAIGQANLNPNRHSYLRVCLPPVEEQQKILSYVASETAKLSALRIAAEKSRILLAERRASLITAAVTGQLPIPEDTYPNLEEAMTCSSPT